MTTLHWSAGAHSKATLSSAGWFSFSVPTGVVGVAVGITAQNLSVDPRETTHGLRFAGGLVHVVESGAQRTLPVGYASTDRFHIVVVGALVLYCRGDAPTQDARVPWPLPGPVLHVSTVALARGIPVHLDAALLSSGDAVVDAERVPVGGTGGVRSRPLQAHGAQGPGAAAALRMAPMLTDGGSGRGAQLAMRPGVASGAEQGGAWASLAMRTLRVGGFVLPAAARGAFVVMRAPTVAGLGRGTSRDWARLTMRAPGVFGSQGPYAQARLRTARMLAIGFSAGMPAGPTMRVTLPAVLGTVPLRVPVDIDELGYGTDGYWIGYHHMVRSVGRGRDVPLPSSSEDTLLTEASRGRDRAYLGRTMVLDERGRGADTASVSSYVLVRETGRAADTFEPGRMSNADIVERAAGRAGPLMQFEQMVREQGSGLDDALIESLVLLREVGAGRDEAELGVKTGLAFVVERGGGTDDAQIQAHTTMLLREAAAGVDEPLLRTQGLTAWVMNTESGGVSWYSGWAFTGMVQAGGTVYAIGPDGLALVGGDDDAGEPIDALIDMGYTDFSGHDDRGRPQHDDFRTQRVVDLWVGYRSSGTLRAMVQTYGSRPYTYTMERRPAGEPVNSRIKPGKALKERFWRIGLSNVAGCSFEINSVAARVAPTSRSF